MNDVDISEEVIKHDWKRIASDQSIELEPETATISEDEKEPVIQDNTETEDSDKDNTQKDESLTPEQVSELNSFIFQGTNALFNNLMHLNVSPHNHQQFSEAMGPLIAKRFPKLAKIKIIERYSVELVAFYATYVFACEVQQARHEKKKQQQKQDVEPNGNAQEAAA